ncbi:MAG: molecular chaperone DnaJ [Candidatus Uhrbacteria bacterium]
MSKDFYKILGVNKNASAEEIKKAFRTLAHQHHPDKAGGNEQKFKEINEAYQVLGDPEKRQKFDQFGSAAFDGSQGFPGSGGFGGFSQGGINFDFSNFEDLGDLFGGAFGFGGGGRRTRGPAHGRDLQVDLNLSFEESVFGASKDITFSKTDSCARCGGVGAEPGSKMKKCSECSGAGYQVRVQRTILGAIQSKVECQACQGEGETAETRCTECFGSGLTKNKKTLTVDVPAGIEDGNSLRLSGQGEAVKGGRAGDLYIRLRVKSDSRFIRDNFDLRSEVAIGFTMAALGGSVEVETVDGKVEVKISAGLQSGTELRLRGKGVGHEGRRGDHIVTVRVITPKNLSKKQKELLEKLDL